MYLKKGTEMTLTEKIEAVVQSATPALTIEREAGLSGSSISNLRTGKREIRKLSLETAEKIGNYYDKTHESNV